MIRVRFVAEVVRLALLLMMAVLVAGCMLGREIGAVSVVAPQVDMAVDPEWPQVDWSLQVQRPQADQMRDSDRILVRVSHSRLQPYPSAAWLDNVPNMLQTLMIQTLEDSNRLAGVGRTGSMRSGFSLATEIRHFEAVDDGQAGFGLHLAIQANLIHHASGRVMATRQFSRQTRVSGKALDALVETFEQDMGALLADLTAWLLSEGSAASEQIEQ